jgi:hypothetical protein
MHSAVIVACPSVASFRKLSTSSRGQVSPGNPSKFDQDQLAAPSALQFVMADLLLWGGGWSVAATVHKFSIVSAMPHRSSSARRKAARPSRIAVGDVLANTPLRGLGTLSSGAMRLTRPTEAARESLADVLSPPKAHK